MTLNNNSFLHCSKIVIFAFMDVGEDDKNHEENNCYTHSLEILVHDLCLTGQVKYRSLNL